MKKIVILAINVLFAASLFAQNGSIVGRVIDEPDGIAVVGAVIEVASIGEISSKKYFTSGYDGNINISGIAYGRYQITISYIGYENLEKNIQITSSTNNIGVLKMVGSSIEMETVVKEAQALRASQKGDTISYNASAFKVSNDSDVEGLLKKMPGISITNGEVEAQGEAVKKIFVDGKEFFGDDVSAAIKTLPAEAVDRIEVYNKLSDAAEFSGVDDGEGGKALNIVTHKHMRSGIFGKISAGYGYDAESDSGSENRHKYIAGGNINMFNDKSRTSIMALVNNVNEQNFSFEDMIGASGGTTSKGSSGNYMARPKSGVATVNAIGVNHSNSWGEGDKLKFQGSYFFNNTDTENNTTANKWFVDPSPTDTLINRGSSNVMNYNHRFNSKIEWKISDKHEVMIRPSFSFQSNNSISSTDGFRFGQSGTNIIDNDSDKNTTKYNARLSAVYRLRLGKTGRTLTVDANGNYSSGESNLLSSTNKSKALRNIDYDANGNYEDYPYPDPVMYYQWQNSPSTSHYLSGRITYTEPLSKASQLNVRYSVSNEYQEVDKKVYANDDGFEDIENGAINDRLSNSYQSTYLIHKVGPGYRFVKDKNYFGASVYYEYSELDGQVIRTDATAIEHSYNNFTYFLMGNLQLNRENTLKIFLRSYTDNPSLNVLQDVYNLSNLQNISKGNPNLNASYSNSLRFHYINTNLEKGRTFMAMMSANMTSDYIGSSIEFNKEIIIDENGEENKYTPFQYSEPVNLDGYWNIRSRLSYGFPINFIKCNLNLSAGINYTNLPSMVNLEFNEASTIGYSGGAVLGSNISENIDFTLNWHGTYNQTANSLSTSAAANRYFNHTASGNIRVVFWEGFTFSAAASYTQYIGYTNDYEDSYILCSAWLGKQFLKSKRAEVSFGVNDILNQNQGFARTTGSGWTQNATNSVMGRYYMLRFTYNLRSFGDRASKSSGITSRGRKGPGEGGRHHNMY